jgi:hypothetical protein
MSIFLKWRVAPFFPLPRSCDRWRVVAGCGGCWWVLYVGTRHFRPATLGGGGGLGCHLAGFPPTQGNIVFCLVLLNYMTSRLFF